MTWPDRRHTPKSARAAAFAPALCALTAFAPLNPVAAAQEPRAAQVRGVVVPDLVRRDSVSAVRALMQVQLVPAPRQRPVSEASLIGRVVDQDPPAATRVQPGSRVAFTVATDGRIVMPAVVARPIQEASAMLRAAGLLVRPVVDTVPGEGDPTGRVVQQVPLPGARISPRTRARLTIARGQVALATVPNVVGRDQRFALDTLLDLRFTPMTRTAAVFSRDSAGRVLEQQPAGGTRAERGTAVSLLIGRDARVAMPSLTGRTLAAARRRLRESGLTGPVAVQRDSGGGDPIDRVAGQSPAVNARVAPSVPVLLTLARAAVAAAPASPPQVAAIDSPTTQIPPAQPTAVIEEVVVPSVTGLALDSARRVLTRAGLAMRVDRSTLLARFPRGRVHAQAPDAGATVVRGAAVTIVPRHLLGVIGVFALLAGAAGIAALAVAHAAWPPPMVTVAARPTTSLPPAVAGGDPIVALSLSLRSRMRDYPPRLHVNGPLVRS